MPELQIDQYFESENNLRINYVCTLRIIRRTCTFGKSIKIFDLNTQIFCISPIITIINSSQADFKLFMHNKKNAYNHERRSHYGDIDPKRRLKLDLLIS